MAITKLLEDWKIRDLSLYGKVTIIKALALSEIKFITTVQVIRNGIVALLNKPCPNFLWDEPSSLCQNGTRMDWHDRC